MAFSADSTDQNTEADGEQSSRFVVDAEQLRDGDFETIADAREALSPDE